MSSDTPRSFQSVPDYGRARLAWARVAAKAPVSARGSARVAKRLLLDQGYFRSARDKAPVDRNGEAVPWYTIPTVDYLRQLDVSDRRIFEYGAGYSTLWWQQRAKAIVAVENDRPWFDRMGPQFDRSKVTHVLREDADSYVAEIAAHEPFDVIAVDGYWRDRCAEAAIEHLAPGGMVILDNSEWVPDVAARLRDAGLIEVDFCGFGPLLDVAWTTSVFFHREARFEPRTGIQPELPRGGMHLPEWRRTAMLEDPHATRRAGDSGRP